MKYYISDEEVSKRLKIVLSTDLFKERGGELYLWLINTHYGYEPLSNVWGSFDAGWVYYSSFEDVMDNVDEEVQTKLLFHLDIFT